MTAIRVLTALDQARTQYYHFKAIVIAGMGLFTDAYDLFCIPPVMKLIGRVYYPADPVAARPGVTPPAVVSATVGVALLGAVAGNLLFGALGDRAGRRRVYGASLLLMVASSIGSGFSVCRTRRCALASLCLFRFLFGVAIGGDYPLSATIMSEFANRRTRGAFIAAVFSMQGFGILASSAVTMAVAAAFDRCTGRRAPLDTPKAADLAWRVILMIGAVPAAVTFYWRMAMPETARYAGPATTLLLLVLVSSCNATTTIDRARRTVQTIMP
jgi:PHS family inorganic phosphate transporter-like MFS transporter